MLKVGIVSLVTIKGKKLMVYLSNYSAQKSGSLLPQTKLHKVLCVRLFESGSNGKTLNLIPFC